MWCPKCRSPWVSLVAGKHRLTEDGGGAAVRCGSSASVENLSALTQWSRSRHLRPEPVPQRTHHRNAPAQCLRETRRPLQARAHPASSPTRHLKPLRTAIPRRPAPKQGNESGEDRTGLPREREVSWTGKIVTAVGTRAIGSGWSGHDSTHRGRHCSGHGRDLLQDFQATRHAHRLRKDFRPPVGSRRLPRPHEPPLTCTGATAEPLLCDRAGVRPFSPARTDV